MYTSISIKTQVQRMVSIVLNVNIQMHYMLLSYVANPYTSTQVLSVKPKAVSTGVESRVSLVFIMVNRIEV